MSAQKANACDHIPLHFFAHALAVCHHLFIFVWSELTHDSNALNYPSKYPDAGSPPSVIIDLIITYLTKEVGYRLQFYHRYKTFLVCLMEKPAIVIWFSIMWENVIMCAYIFVIRYRLHGLNSNMFLSSGNCYVCLRKKSTCFGSKITQYPNGFVLNVLCLLSCHSASLALQHAGFVSREWP